MRRERPGRTVRGRRVGSLVGSVIGGLAFAFGCASDEREKTPTELYPSRYASAVCAEYESCCRANGLSFDRGKCELSAAIYVQGGVDRAAKAGAALDPAKADQCIEAAVAATKTCKTVSQVPAANVACASVWSGPKKNGESCNGDLECETTDNGIGACLKTAGPDNPGTCVTKTKGADGGHASVGDVCGKTPDGTIPTTIADCDGSGLQCSILSGTCSELVPIGQQCGNFNRCQKGAFCATDTCTEALPAGSACSENQQCAGGLCIKEKCAANAVGDITACTGIVGDGG
jgi:hypothetical protein